MSASDASSVVTVYRDRASDGRIRRWLARWFTPDLRTYVLLAVVVVVLVAAKAGLAKLGAPALVRQVVLVFGLGVLTFQRVGRPSPTLFLRMVGLLPLRPNHAESRWPLVRLTLGVVAAAAAIGSAAVDTDRTQWWLVGAAAALAALLILIEIARFVRWRYPRSDVAAVAAMQRRVTDGLARSAPEPDAPKALAPKMETRLRPRRIAVWVTLPLVIAGVATTSSLLGDHENTNMTGGELGELLFVTAFGEELLFRGLLLVLAYRLLARPPAERPGDPPRAGRARAEIATAVAFGLWHVPDAVVDGSGEGIGIQIAVVIGQLVATTGAGFIFSWMRHRTESLAGPTALHVATNLPGIALVS